MQLTSGLISYKGRLSTEHYKQKTMKPNLIVALQNSDICCSAIPFTYNIIFTQKYSWDSLDAVTVFG